MPITIEPRPKKLLDQARDSIRRKHCSSTTDESYANWIKRFSLFHKKCHPLDLGRKAVEAFITRLASSNG